MDDRIKLTAEDESGERLLVSVRIGSDGGRATLSCLPEQEVITVPSDAAVQLLIRLEECRALPERVGERRSDVLDGTWWIISHRAGDGSYFRLREHMPDPIHHPRFFEAVEALVQMIDASAPSEAAHQWGRDLLKAMTSWGIIP